jgi:hypothetical protein
MRGSGGQPAAGVAACQCNNETLFVDENMKHAQEMNAETKSVAGMRYCEWAASSS